MSQSHEVNTVADIVRFWAKHSPGNVALVCDNTTVSYGLLDAAPAHSWSPLFSALSKTTTSYCDDVRALTASILSERPVSTKTIAGCASSMISTSSVGDSRQLNGAKAHPILPAPNHVSKKPVLFTPR